MVFSDTLVKQHGVLTQGILWDIYGYNHSMGWAKIPLGFRGFSRFPTGHITMRSQ